MFTWQWWVAQTFVLIALALVIVSTQQKSAIRICFFKGVSTVFSCIGVCFLGQLSAIVLNAVGIARSALAIYFAYKPTLKHSIKATLTSTLMIILIALNIAFWQGYQSILCIVVGILSIIAYIQTNPKMIRIMVCTLSIISCIYYILIQSPMNAVIDMFGFISSLIGIIRIDLKNENSPDNKDNNLENKDDGNNYYGL